MNYKIHYFTTDNGSSEAIIISGRPTDELREEYEGDGFELVKSLDIAGSAMDLPRDRLLSEA